MLFRSISLSVSPPPPTSRESPVCGHAVGSVCGRHQDSGSGRGPCGLQNQRWTDSHTQGCHSTQPCWAAGNHNPISYTDTLSEHTHTSTHTHTYIHAHILYTHALTQHPSHTEKHQHTFCTNPQLEYCTHTLTN